MLPIIQAYAEGKEIEIFDKTKRMWITAILPLLTVIQALIELSQSQNIDHSRMQKSVWQRCKNISYLDG